MKSMERIWDVNAALPVHYQVRLVTGLLDPDNPALLEAGATEQPRPVRRLVVMDARVARLYGARVVRYLEHHGVEHELLPLPVSESEKTMASVFRVLEAIQDFGVSRRRDPIIAMGGGVLLDVVGLAASLYRRSTPYVRIPTTLIGQVDAGVGAKTGVNHGVHKNRLGSYFPSRVTLLDRSFLKTLDVRHIGNGLAEILKIALVKDSTLFDLLDRHGPDLLGQRLQTHQTIDAEKGEPDPGATIVERAITGMLEELEPNLWEHKLERLVDFGHSFSPTLEMVAMPELLHGEAVNVDMALSVLLSVQRGAMSVEQQDRVFGLMRRLNLPLFHPRCEPTLLERALSETVRHRDGRQRLPLGVGIGSACFVNDLQPAEISSAADSLKKLSLEYGEVPSPSNERRTAHG